MGFNNSSGFGFISPGASGGGGGGGVLAVPLQFTAAVNQSTYTNALLVGKNVAVFVEGGFEDVGEYDKPFASDTVTWNVNIDGQRINILY